MTFVYIFFILIQAGIIIYFVRRGRKQSQTNVVTNKPTDDSYEAQRSLAMSVTPAQLKLNIPGDSSFVYGVVMDWNTGDSICTLAAYINGAANLYFSNGGGVKGGGTNPDVGAAAVKFVDLAQGYVNSALPTILSGAPGKDCVRFYLLTSNHPYVAQEQVKHFDDGTSAWLPLFKMGNEVIAEMMN